MAKLIEPITLDSVFGAVNLWGRKHYTYAVLINGRVVSTRSHFATYELAEARLRALYPNVIKIPSRDLRMKVRAA